MNRKLFCMFTSSTRVKEKSETLFFYDKSLPMGSISERGVSQFLNCVDNPKGSDAYKKLFAMSTEKNFVAANAVRVTVTPAQKALLEFCNHQDAKALAKEVRYVHDQGTYFVPLDQVHQDSSYTVRTLQDLLTAIAVENTSLSTPPNSH